MFTHQRIFKDDSGSVICPVAFCFLEIWHVRHRDSQKDKQDAMCSGLNISAKLLHFAGDSAQLEFFRLPCVKMKPSSYSVVCNLFAVIILPCICIYIVEWSHARNGSLAELCCVRIRVIFSTARGCFQAILRSATRCHDPCWRILWVPKIYRAVSGLPHDAELRPAASSK